MTGKGKDELESSSAGDKKRLDLSVPDHMSKDKLKAIENTYDVYSDESLELKKQKTSKEKVSGALENAIDRAMESKPSSKKSMVKKIVFEIDSLEDLNPELQKSIKKLLNNISKDEVNTLIREIEIEQEKLIKGNNGIFGKMSSNERNQLEKKLDEMQVSRDINEVNLSAILSCLNNLVIE